MKTEFLNAFKRLGLKTMQEAEGAKLFLDGCTVQVLITSLDESMTESEVYSHLENFNTDEIMHCTDETQLNHCLKMYENILSHAGSTEDIYCLIKPVGEKKLNGEADYFVGNLKMPNTGNTQNYSTDENTFIQILKEYAGATDSSLNDLLSLLGLDYADLKLFMDKYKKLVLQEFSRMCDFLFYDVNVNWLLGNGCYLPETVHQLNDDGEMGIFELAIYSNLVAITQLSMPSNLKNFKGLRVEILQGLIKYLNEILDLNDSDHVEKLRIGTLDEYTLKKDGYHILSELESDDIDEIFCENDYSIHIIKRENNRYLMDSITGAFDSYNNGGIYDLRELIDALSKFLDLSEMEFLARLTRR